jgi:hypothetical protein
VALTGIWLSRGLKLNCTLSPTTTPVTHSDTLNAESPCCTQHSILRRVFCLTVLPSSFANRFVDALNITDNAEFANPDDHAQFLMRFSGCGVVYGGRGIIFAHGLEEQINTVLSRLDALITRFPTVTLNAIGLSRGACACLMLAKAIANQPRVILNILVFDPVPGNLIRCITRPGIVFV